ncbi:hypothetical protein P3X46_000747 [Hevea brasiliensis]|uniref:Retrotransposon gag domain-containing protein n=1 Tax=Hevea brasiliensis TaxID=3981 RepID=A0ABQ9NAC2_HEVBR|nr:hypothetical protein P3X46_000747 [Hevea brasiliensis]
MQGLRWSIRLTDAPYENESIGALPGNPIIREKASRGGKKESSRGPKRCFEVKSSRELKVVEFKQLGHTTDMSVDEYIDKFVEFLKYMGQEYDTNKKKAKRYTQRLHSRHSLLSLATETYSFHSINKFWNRIKSGLRMGGSSSSSSNTSDCVRCGNPHRGVYRFGTFQCYQCGQEGHMSWESFNMESMASQQQTRLGSLAQPAVR